MPLLFMIIIIMANWYLPYKYKTEVVVVQDGFIQKNQNLKKIMTMKTKNAMAILAANEVRKFKMVASFLKVFELSAKKPAFLLRSTN